jgi:DNA-binding NarL/FixJ family response regulator
MGVPMPTEARVVALIDDLFFAVQVRDEARRAGLGFISAKDAAQALALAGEGPSVVVIDLELGRVAPLELIRDIKAAAPGTRLLGYLAHEQVDLRQRALAAGCDAAVPKAAFARTLRQVVEAQAGAAVQASRPGAS